VSPRGLVVAALAAAPPAPGTGVHVALGAAGPGAIDAVFVPAPAKQEQEPLKKVLFGRQQFLQVYHDAPLVVGKRSVGGGSAAASAGAGGAVDAADDDPVAAAAAVVAAADLRGHAPVVPPAGAPSPSPSLLPVVKEPRVPISNFEVDFAAIETAELIGQGAFGRVYRGCVVVADVPVWLWCVTTCKRRP
jgi:hypothetical protein